MNPFNKKDKRKQFQNKRKKKIENLVQQQVIQTRTNLKNL